MAKVFCNNGKCTFYQANQECLADEVFCVDRLCVTFKRRRTEPDYAAMMQVQRPGCHREHGKYVSDKVTGVLR